MKSSSHWLACKPLAEINLPAWVEDIQKDAALELTPDDIFTLKVEHDMMKVHNASDLAPQRLHLREVISKIIRQCEGRE